MPNRPARRAPAGLGRRGKALWKAVTDDYELRVDELLILEEACREVDLIDRLNEAIGAEGFELIVTGSMGQPVTSPLAQEIRQHRTLVAQLLARLKLPDGEEGAPRSDSSTSARNAARKSWGR